MAGPARTDLLFEDRVTMDGSGDYTGDWIDTGGVLTVRVAFQFANVAQGTFLLQEGMNTSYGSSESIIWATQPTAASNKGGIWGGEADVNLVGRYIRFTLSGGDPSDYCFVTIRKVA